ncbi:MAG: carbohydrate-binding protein [Kiritimatiellae bacterium]|nr:carbohydrate-binding protein [Kiritimatiellia bacterium]
MNFTPFFITIFDPSVAPTISLKTDNNNGSNYTICCVGNESSAASFSPPAPTGCDSITISYSPNNGPLANAGSVKVHLGRNGWAETLPSDPTMTKNGDTWEYVHQIEPGTIEINCVFNDGGAIWDNNDGNDWNVTVADCGDFAVTNPTSGSISVSYATSSFVPAGYCNTSRYSGHIAWSNAANGLFGQIPVAQTWSIADEITLALGTNLITVIASNNTVQSLGDSSDDPAYALGWADGANGGTGFNAWSLTAEDNSGFAIASSDEASNLSLGETAWCMWANGGAQAQAVRTLKAPLVEGDTFSVKLDNNFIETGKGMGIALQNAAGQTLWQFWFNGGDINYNMTSVESTQLGWTGDGLEIDFKLTDTNSFEATVTPAGSPEAVFSGVLNSQTDKTVSQFRAWNYSTGAGTEYNVYFDDISITPLLNGGVVTTSITFAVIRSAEQGQDADDDGIDDSWEDEHFGSASQCDPDDDDDGDGLSNKQEFWLGTNPKAKDSALEFGDDCLMTNGKPGFSWKTVGGKTYIIEYTENLTSPYQSLATITEDDVADGTESTETYVDTTYSESTTTRYYRIKVIVTP